MDPSQENAQNSWALVNAGILFALMTLFSYPLLQSWSMSYDENVQYWIGTYMFWWTVPIPIWFFIHYMIQISFNKPKRAMVMASFILSCVVFFLVGGSVRFRAMAIMDRVSGSDCGVYKDTRALVQAHGRAEEKYKVCHPAGGKSGFDVLFQSCAKYKEWRKEEDNAKHWDYLMYLETNFACTGFCKPAEESLWSHKEYHDRANWDACNNVVYSVMLSKVSRGGLIMMCYPAFVIVGFLLWHCAVRPTFQRMTAGQQRTLASHIDPAIHHKAAEVLGFAKEKARNAYGAVHDGLERGVERVRQEADHLYSPRQPMPPQPVFIPASQQTLPPGPQGPSMTTTLPPGGAHWSAPPAPGYANPQMPPMPEERNEAVLMKKR